MTKPKGKTPYEKVKVKKEFDLIDV